MTRSLFLLLCVALLQVATACKNCVVLGKAEQAMFRAHSASCQARSGVERSSLDALLRGEVWDSPALRRHVYCVLLQCKLVGKDGKLLKSAALGKLSMRPDGRHAGKLLESCSERSQEQSPEDAAWRLFRCGYDKRGAGYDSLPAGHMDDATHN